MTGAVPTRTTALTVRVCASWMWTVVANAVVAPSMTPAGFAMVQGPGKSAAMEASSATSHHVSATSFTGALTAAHATSIRVRPWTMAHARSPKNSSTAMGRVQPALTARKSAVGPQRLILVAFAVAQDPQPPVGMEASSAMLVAVPPSPFTDAPMARPVIMIHQPRTMTVPVPTQRLVTTATEHA